MSDDMGLNPGCGKYFYFSGILTDNPFHIS